MTPQSPGGIAAAITHLEARVQHYHAAHQQALMQESEWRFVRHDPRYRECHPEQQRSIQQGVTESQRRVEVCLAALTAALDCLHAVRDLVPTPVPESQESVTFTQLTTHLFDLRDRWRAAGVGSPLRPGLEAEYAALYRDFVSRGGERRLALLLWIGSLSYPTTPAD